MRTNNEVNYLKLNPFVWLVLACMFVHAIFSSSSKFYIIPEGFFIILIGCMFLSFYFKQKIVKFTSKHMNLITTSAVLLVFIFFSISKGDKPLLILLILLVIFTFFAFKIGKRINTANAVLFIFIITFLLHVTYILYTPYYIRQHDSYTIEFTNGHIGYIQYILNNNFQLFKGDPTKVMQFYHPPLHHYIAAIWVKVNTILGMSYSKSIESIQILTLFYSGCINIICYRIFQELRFKGNAFLVPFALVCFHPTFTLLSGSINNDILSILFMLLAILYAIRWYRSEKLSHIIAIALAVGLGMSTKLSVFLVTPAIAFLFIYKLIKIIKRKKLLIQYVLFALICIPLGIWHSLYYYFTQGMPLGYVHNLGKESFVYIGEHSVFDRLIGFKNMHFKKLYVEFFGKYKDYNIPVFILKSSVFGEWSFGKDATAILFSIILFASNILAIFCSFICGVIYFVKNKRDRILKAFFGILYVVIFGSYIKFCFDYPHICTQDFRYIVPTLVIGAITIGYVLNEKRNRILSSFITLITVFFPFSSVMLYLLYGV